MKKIINIFMLFMIISLSLGQVYSHCDTMDGPVITAAKTALEKENINYVLIWIKPEHEKELKQIFNEVLEVRKIDDESKILADKYFFENFVRIHRAGEGAPYTGLKPAGLDMGPIIPAADRAVEMSSLKPLQNLIPENLHDELKEKFEKVIGTKNYDVDNVAEGREYVEAYVQFMHFAEAASGEGHDSGVHGEHTSNHSNEEHALEFEHYSKEIIYGQWFLIAGLITLSILKKRKCSINKK